jgi:hypothetical protein
MYLEDQSRIQIQSTPACSTDGTKVFVTFKVVSSTDYGSSDRRLACCLRDAHATNRNWFGWINTSSGAAKVVGKEVAFGVACCYCHTHALPILLLSSFMQKCSFFCQRECGGYDIEAKRTLLVKQKRYIFRHQE